MRQIVLDTETTGLEVSQGHRIIEIGCVELIDRKLTGRHYHQYIQPHRDIDDGALAVHGITQQFLADKPPFEQIVEPFLSFVDGADLIIHNAPFDVGFLDAELERVDPGGPSTASRYAIIDSLTLARTKHPGQRNSLDALCQRYEVDNSSRSLHGALLDAEILAEVYLAMTGGQTSLVLSDEDNSSGEGAQSVSRIRRLPVGRRPLRIIKASDEELERHQEKLAEMREKAGHVIPWPA